MIVQIFAAEAAYCGDAKSDWSAPSNVPYYVKKRLFCCKILSNYKNKYWSA